MAGGWAITDGAEEILTVDELRASITGFSQADHLRLGRAARILCGGSGFEWNDLINEAVVRALAGSRNCPRATSPVVFLVGAMRSIVSTGREVQARERENESLAATGTDGKREPVTLPCHFGQNPYKPPHPWFPAGS